MLTSQKTLFLTFHPSLVPANLCCFKLGFLHTAYSIHTKLGVLLTVILKISLQHLRNII